MIRSKSVPTSRLSDREPDGDGETTSFPALVTEPVADPGVPSWMRELANERAGRHSRASSMVSTRTRFSTTTLDDARSIDIMAGGQTFRISRYGDQVTDTTAPPPYSDPVYDGDIPLHPEILHLDSAGEEEPHQQHRKRRAGGRHPRRVRIAMPGQEDLDDANEAESPAVGTPSKTLTEEDLRQLILDLPLRLKKVLGIGATRTDRGGPQPPGAIPQTSRSYEAGDIDGRSSSSVAPDKSEAGDLEDRPGYRLRATFQNGLGQMSFYDTIMTQPEDARWPPLSERTRLQLQDLQHRIGRDPLIPQGSGARADSRHEPEDSTENVGATASGRPALVPESRPSENEPSVPLTVGDLNELSRIYNRVIRDLDREHRTELHKRDKEMDQLRILLHEKDVVYRQLLKGKDFVIDDLMKKLDHSKGTLEVRLEQARNQVEDLWETRWKEHDRQLIAKCGLMKPSPQDYVTNGTQTDAT